MSVIKITLPSGLIVYQARYRDPVTGKREARNFKKKTDAVTRHNNADRKKTLLRAGYTLNEVQYEPVTFADFVARFDKEWINVKGEGVGEDRERYERDIVDRYIAPVFGVTDMAQITDAAVQEFQVRLTKEPRPPKRGESQSNGEPLRPSTVNSVMRVLIKIVRRAASSKVIPRDAVPQWPDPVDEPKTRQAFDPQEKRNFFAAFDDRAGYMRYRKQNVQQLDPALRKHASFGRVEDDFKRFRAFRTFFFIAAETGLDRKDLIELEWSMVDVDDRCIVKDREKTKVETPIALSDEAVSALAKLRKRVGRYVFTKEAGKQIDVTTVNRHFSTAKRIAKLERRFRFKDLRHTAANDFIEAGGSMEALQVRLGHKDIKTTQIYLTMRKDAALASQRAAVERVAKPVRVVKRRQRGSPSA